MQSVIWLDQSLILVLLQQIDTLDMQCGRDTQWSLCIHRFMWYQFASLLASYFRIPSGGVLDDRDKEGRVVLNRTYSVHDCSSPVDVTTKAAIP